MRSFVRRKKVVEVARSVACTVREVMMMQDESCGRVRKWDEGWGEVWSGRQCGGGVGDRALVVQVVSPGWLLQDNYGGPSFGLSLPCHFAKIAPRQSFSAHPPTPENLGHKEHTSIKQKSWRETSRGNEPKLDAARSAWFWREIVQIPNALSLSRMLSGPVIAYWIVSSQWPLALVGLIVSGATDWLDGYVAKKQGKQSVLGSYLDPLADKVLICCTVGALVWRGSLPVWVAATVIARDVFLVVGTLLHYSDQRRGLGSALVDYIRHSKGQKSELVQPFFISKINTVVQMSLAIGCMSQGWLGWPGADEILLLSEMTVGSTLLSWAAYVHAYRRGRRAIP